MAKINELKTKLLDHPLLHQMKKPLQDGYFADKPESLIKIIYKVIGKMLDKVY